MARTLALFMYKVRFFFGPALRSRVGPLAFLALIVIFAPTGFGFGFGLAQGMKGAPAGQAIGMLSAPLSFFLALALFYSILSGVTAHVSEFDFFMTADVRPREYLLSDLMFQFFSMFGAGGLAALVSAFGIVSGLGRPLIAVVPLVAILFAFALLFLLVIQLVTVLRVRYPKAPVRGVAGLFIILSLLPAVPVAVSAFPIRFDALPTPMTAFGTLGYDVLMGLPPDLSSLAIGALSFLVIGGAWFAVSDTYIFHGIHPSLSAGFGQVDMAARLAQQRRTTARLGRVTTRVSIRTDRGSDTSLMTRFHLLRIVRDGSLIAIAMFAVLSIVPAQFSGMGGRPPNAGSEPAATQLGTYMLTLLGALLALNWSYHERENLWIVLTSGKTPAAYFRGLMVSLMVVGLFLALAFLAFYAATSPSNVSLPTVAVPIAAAIAAALMATVCLTRLKVQLAAFSLSMLAILVSVVVAGFLGGYLAQAILVAVQVAFGLGLAVQAPVFLAYCAGLMGFGSWLVSRLAAGFHL